MMHDSNIKEQLKNVVSRLFYLTGSNTNTGSIAITMLLMVVFAFVIHINTI